MRTSWRLLFRLARPYRRRYLLGLLFLAATDLVQLAIPQVLGAFTDALEGGIPADGDARRYALALLALAVAAAFLRYLWRMYIHGTARQLEHDLRQVFFRHLLRLEAGFYLRRTTGDLMAHATNDVLAVRSAAGQGLLMAADAVMLSAATLVAVFLTVDWRLALLGLLPLPLLAAGAAYFGRVIHQRFSQVQAGFSDLTGRVQENLAGIRVVKAFGQEAAETERFAAVNEEYVRRYLHMVRVQALLDPLTQLLASLGFVAVIGYGGWLVSRGQMTLGGLVAFTSYLASLSWPMLAIGWVVNMVQRASASLERLDRILCHEPEIDDDMADRSITRLHGEIEIRGLTFRYAPGLPPVLSDIRLHIRPGETVAVVGRTGSGKTTLVNLLLRVFEPPAGSILFDGVPIERIPLATLRGEIGYVPQDNFLFSATIAENIGFAPGVRNPEAIEAAARAAGLDPDIAGFPDGFQTLLGERGITLSGGQKQRLGIARALVKEPPILILDDALSAVDTETEARILERLRSVRESRTCIIAAHRLSTVQDADRIIVLAGGKLAEEGRHEELLQRRGLYWRMYQEQQRQKHAAAAGR